jgi:predicted metalloprotease with PDZ domain
VLVRAGDAVTGATVGEDWVMTHELLHVALPSLPREQAWLGEGLPSYVEPIVRVRAGLATPERLWLDLVKGLPQGLPDKGDEGLDRTHTWGRTYWGGSLFCLVADVRIREQTANSRSLDDVVRAVVASGADVESHWDVERFLDAGDRATGTHVLSALYGELALAPGSIDLGTLWKRLGVVVAGDQVTFDDRAPLAHVRRGIAGR